MEKRKRKRNEGRWRGKKLLEELKGESRRRQRMGTDREREKKR